MLESNLMVLLEDWKIALEVLVLVGRARLRH